MAIKDDMIAPIASSGVDIPVIQNRDLTTLAGELGYKNIPGNVWAIVGPKISKAYHDMHGTGPPKTKKHCNGALRDINVYTDVDVPWIKGLLGHLLSIHAHKYRRA